MKKSVLAVLLALVLVICAGAVTASAAVTPQSGKWGSLNWSLDANGVLTISGSGTMSSLKDAYDDDEEEYTYFAWRKYRSSISSVIINSGVKNISYNAFSGCTNLTSVSIPGSVPFA